MGILIELSSYPIFTSNLGTLESTSFDDKNGQIMTASQRIVTNFDHVKNVYSRSHHLSEFLTSIDALFNDKNGNLVFVEFKNGFLDKKEQYCLQKKLYDSILILLDTTSEPFSSFREQSKFILVYNNSANSSNRDPDFLHKMEARNGSTPSLDCIAKSFSSFAHTEYVCFGLKPFCNYCFKEVHTYTQSEFEHYLETL